MANVKTSIHNNNKGRPSKFSRRFHNSKRRSNNKGNNINNNTNNLNNLNNLNNNVSSPEIVVESGILDVSYILPSIPSPPIQASTTQQNTNENINANSNIIIPKRKPQINTRPNSKILNQTNIQNYIDLTVKNLPRKYRNDFLDEEIVEPTQEEMETSEQQAAQKKKNKRKKPVDPVKVEFNKNF
ncbi:hypothetical protein B5S31_g3064 [[Candida] boidinii]|nr:hypothetical protein B5S31_g3064 [[Candida] boidinii]